MTLHKLTAGSGYEYLARQVAALDSTEKGRTTLADYYSAKGESPGRWVGSGLAGIDGLEAGDVVTAEQMNHLFGSGCDPLSGLPLGSPYKLYRNESVDEFNAEVARRIDATGQTSLTSRPISGVRWHGSSLFVSMVASLDRLWNCRPRSPGIRVLVRARWRDST